MLESIVKVAITSVMVVAVAEVAKRSSIFAALIASLPLTSVLAMVWLYLDTGDADRIAELARGIFWLVLPSLVLFVALPVLIKYGVAFWPAFLVSIGLTILSYFLMLKMLGHFGIST